MLLSFRLDFDLVESDVEVEVDTDRDDDERLNGNHDMLDWCEMDGDWVEIGQRSGVGILTRLLEREIRFLKYAVVVGEVV